MNARKLFPCQMNDAIFHVTHYKDGMVTGWLSHPRLDDSLKIQSIPQFLFALNDVLSQEDAPIARHPLQQPTIPEDLIATIRLQVLFREHYTWQGYIIWEEQQMKASFRSVLELIEILDEILAE